MPEPNRTCPRCHPLYLDRRLLEYVVTTEGLCLNCKQMVAAPASETAAALDRAKRMVEAMMHEFDKPVPTLRVTHEDAIAIGRLIGAVEAATAQPASDWKMQAEREGWWSPETVKLQVRDFNAIVDEIHKLPPPRPNRRATPRATASLNATRPQPPLRPNRQTLRGVPLAGTAHTRPADA